MAGTKAPKGINVAEAGDYENFVDQQAFDNAADAAPVLFGAMARKSQVERTLEQVRAEPTQQPDLPEGKIEAPKFIPGGPS